MSTSFDPRVRLRPRTLDETLDLTLMYAVTFRRDFLRLMAWLVLPLTVLLMLLKLGVGLEWNIIAVITIVCAPMLERVMTAYAGEHLFGNTPSPRSALNIAFKRPQLAALGAFIVPLPLIPILLSSYDDFWVVLGMLAAVFWPFALAQAVYFTQVVLLEKLPARDAYRRASALVAARYARSIGFVAASFTGRLLCVIGAELIARFVVTTVLQLGEPIDTIIDNQGSWPAVIGYLLAAPMIGLARLFDYIDARTRREGWDIQIRFRAIDAKAKAERANRLAA